MTRVKRHTNAGRNTPNHHPHLASRHGPRGRPRTTSNEFTTDASCIPAAAAASNRTQRKQQHVHTTQGGHPVDDPALEEPAGFEERPPGPQGTGRNVEGEWTRGRVTRGVEEKNVVGVMRDHRLHRYCIARWPRFLSGDQRRENQAFCP